MTTSIFDTDKELQEMWQEALKDEEFVKELEQIEIEVAEKAKDLQKLKERSE